MHADEAQSAIKELESLRTQTNMWRWGLTLVFAVVTVASVLVMWTAANGLTQDGPQKQKFIGYLSADLQNTVLPSAEQIGAGALHQINFGDEISKLNKRTPDVANATVEQFKSLATELPKRSEQTLDDQFDTVLQDREAKLKAAFPGATDEQIASLMSNITSEAHSQVADLTDELFSPHVAAMNSIVTDLGTIEAKEGDSIKGETPTWQMAFMVADIARADFANLQAQQDAASGGRK